MPIIETCCLGYVLDLIGFDARALDPLINQVPIFLSIMSNGRSLA